MKRSNQIRTAAVLLAAILLSMAASAGLPVYGADGETVLSGGAAVTCSSVWDDPEGFWRLSFLTDGSLTQTWPLPAGKTLGWRSAVCPAREADITLDVDLGGPASVSGIRLYPRGNGGLCFPSDYTLSVSADGKVWTEVASVTDDDRYDKGEGETVRSFACEAASVRYVRLHITKLSKEMDGSDRVCELSEVEVMGAWNQGLVLNRDALWLAPGERETLTAVLYGGAGTSSLTYTVEGDSGVLSVSPDGEITALGIGTAAVRVRDGASGSEAVCQVRVLNRDIDNILITVPVWGNGAAITEEQFRWLREADVDAVMAVGHNNSNANTRKMLDTAAAIYDESLDRNLGVFIHSYNQGITPSSTDAEIVAYARQYRHTPAFLGYHIEDEPFDPNPYARLERLLKQEDPYSVADVNFLPGQVYGSWAEYTGRMSDYGKLVSPYNSYLSFDNYPFGPADGSVDENGLFGNFEAVRTASRENGVPAAFYLQSVGSARYGYRRPDEGVMRYHIAAALSYGFKWIKYYSWFVPGADGTPEGNDYTDAVMSHDCQKTDLYDVAAGLNREVHNVGGVLVNLDAAEVYHTGARSTASVYKQLPQDFFVQPEGDCYAIVSLMENKTTGQQYLMIVSKDFTRSVTMRFRLKGVSSLTELDKRTDGGRLSPDYADGLLTRTFLPGEFALYELSESGHGTKAAQTDDLLLGRPVSVSDSASGDGWFARCVNDGVTNEAAVTGQKGWRAEVVGGTPRLEFDLGRICEMNRLDVYPAGVRSTVGLDFPTHIRVSASADGQTWQTVLDAADLPRPTTEVPVLRFETAAGRYVRIEFPDCGRLALAELMLYNDDGSLPLPDKTSYEEPQVIEGENIALRKPVRASRSYTDAVWNPKFMTDGTRVQSWPTDQTLGWHSGNHDKREVENLYVYVDLEAFYRVNTVVLYPRGNGGICFPSDFEVKLSNDAENWTTVYAVTDSERLGEAERTITFDPAEARYVGVFVSRLSDDIDSGGYVCEFSEIEVFAAQAADTEADTEPETEPASDPDTAPAETGRESEPAETAEQEPDTASPASSAPETTPSEATAPETTSPDTTADEARGCACAAAGSTLAAAVIAAAVCASDKRKREE